MIPREKKKLMRFSIATGPPADYFPVDVTEPTSRMNKLDELLEIILGEFLPFIPCLLGSGEFRHQLLLRKASIRMTEVPGSQVLALLTFVD